MDLTSLVNFFGSHGYLAVFGILLLCGFGLPVPEDISLLAGGIISALGYTDVHLMVAVALAGVMIGDGVIYFAGRIFGEVLFHRKIVGRFISHDRYASARSLLAKYGRRVIFAARFMPGLRAPIFLTAGITRFVSPGQFFMIDGFAAMISVPVWVYLGYVGANNIDRLTRIARQSRFGIIGIILLLVIIFIVAALIRRGVSGLPLSRRKNDKA